MSEKRWGADKGEGRRVPGNLSNLDGIPSRSRWACSREVWSSQSGRVLRLR
jgi:hypothetical protein